MNTYKWLSMISLFCMLSFLSCSDDSLISPEGIVERRGQGPDGPNDPNNNDNKVRELTHYVLSSWTDLLLEIDRYATGMRPNATARSIAYIQLAGYETIVSGMRNFRSCSSKFDELSIDNNERANRIDYELALNAAMATSVDHFIYNLPSDQKAKILDLYDELKDELAQGVPESRVTSSEKWGAYVAERVIAYSETDEEAEAQKLEPQPTSYEPPTGDGYWTYSADEERALFPYWGSVRTFVISTDETTTVEPISYSEDPSSEYFQQMEEVYTVNNIAKEDQNEDLWIAEFWSDDVEGLMFSPPARQLSIANQLLKEKNVNLERAMYFFLKLGFALNDSAVNTWAYKYQHMVMRPNVYIHEFIDPDFQTNLYRLIYWPNPSFPGYPSGHSCFASAGAGVFIEFFGNQIDFTDTSHEGRTEFQGEPRSFTSFEEMAEENAFSRIPLGVHIRMDCTEGVRLGYEISDAVNAFNLKKNPT